MLKEIYFEETKISDAKKNASWISYVKTVSRICQHSKETGRGMTTIKIEHTE